MAIHRLKRTHKRKAANVLNGWSRRPRDNSSYPRSLLNPIKTFIETTRFLWTSTQLLGYFIVDFDKPMQLICQLDRFSECCLQTVCELDICVFILFNFVLIRILLWFYSRKIRFNIIHDFFSLRNQQNLIFLFVIL